MLQISNIFDSLQITFKFNISAGLILRMLYIFMVYFCKWWLFKEFMSLDNLSFTLSPKFNLQNSLWLTSIHPLQSLFPAVLKKKPKSRNSAECVHNVNERPWAVGDRGDRRGETAVSVNEWDKRHRSEDGEEDANSSVQGFWHNCLFLYRRRQSFKAAKQDLRSNSLVIIQRDSKCRSWRSGWWRHSVSAQFLIENIAYEQQRETQPLVFPWFRWGVRQDCTRRRCNNAWN